MSTKKTRLVLMTEAEIKQRIEAYRERMEQRVSRSNLLEAMIMEALTLENHTIKTYYNLEDRSDVKKIRMVVYIDHSTFETLEEYSYRTGLNRSAVAEKLILEYLDHYEIWMAPERAVESKIRITRSISIELAEKLDSLQYEGTDNLSFQSKSKVMENLLTEYFELRAKGLGTNVLVTN